MVAPQNLKSKCVLVLLVTCEMLFDAENSKAFSNGWSVIGRRNGPAI